MGVTSLHRYIVTSLHRAGGGMGVMGNMGTMADGKWRMANGAMLKELDDQGSRAVLA